MKTKTFILVEINFLAAILFIAMLLSTIPADSTLAYDFATGLEAAILWLTAFSGFGYALYLLGKHKQPKCND